MIHTTKMGADRIKRNLNLDMKDVVGYCKNLILSKELVLSNRNGFVELYKLAEEGWFVKGTDYKSIIIHELGHVFSNRYHINSLEITKKILNFEKVDDIMNYLSSELSNYAAEVVNGNEIIAEIDKIIYKRGGS